MNDATFRDGDIPISKKLLGEAADRLQHLEYDLSQKLYELLGEPDMLPVPRPTVDVADRRKGRR